MFDFFLFLSFLFVFTIARCPTDTTCDPNFNKCYKFVDEELEYLDAEESCQRLGGHLTSIQNVFENEVIKETAQSMFNGFKHYWVGGNHILQNTWTWTDGTPWIYTNWMQDMPGDFTALTVDLSSGLWTAESPSVRKAYVCGLPYANRSTTTPKNTVFTTGSTPAVKSLCDDGWTHFNGFCYKVIPLIKLWQEAEDFCIYSGAHLVSIHSEEENNFVNDLAAIGINNTRITWTGMHKKNGKWFYTDDSTVDFFNWTPGSPDGKGDLQACVITFPDAYPKYPAKHWDDDSCEDNWNHVNFVCKKPKN